MIPTPHTPTTNWRQRSQTSSGLRHASPVYQLVLLTLLAGAPGLPTTKEPHDGSNNKLIHPTTEGGVGDSGDGGTLWGGGGSSGGSRRGSNNESLFTTYSSDTDRSESSIRAWAQVAASAVVGVEDDDEGMHAATGADRSLDFLGWGRDGPRGPIACDVEGDGVGAGDIGEPAVERRSTSSRLALFPGMDEGMGCIEEEPEQLDT